MSISVSLPEGDLTSLAPYSQGKVWPSQEVLGLRHPVAHKCLTSHSGLISPYIWTDCDQPEGRSGTQCTTLSPLTQHGTWRHSTFHQIQAFPATLISWLLPSVFYQCIFKKKKKKKKLDWDIIHTLQLTHFMYVIQWVLVYSQSCAIIATINFQTFFIIPQRKLLTDSHSPFHPTISNFSNHSSTFCLYGFASSVHLI